MSPKVKLTERPVPLRQGTHAEILARLTALLKLKE